MRSDQNGCPNRLGVFGYPHIWRESRWRSDSSRDRRIANSPSSSSNNISLLSCLVTVPVKSWSGSTSAQRASSVIRSLVSMRLSRINFFSSSIALRRSGVACCGDGVLISMVPKGYPQDCDDDESCADSIKLQTRRQRLPMLTMAILPGQTNQIGFCDPLPQQSPNSFNINAFRFV